ncbi:sensor histidine kinase [Alkalicoccus daliensis]|uniref:histidine kinase n=1 Tax=Alkalicoccus daliensis TaxID=745820 RepID=A0A1H0ISU6_9BACI|nr:ATP-binding protein [Alkalicoccus daliensis]SDO34546.1 Signal transduction histidine kinase [Alkalicoccus daliensis]
MKLSQRITLVSTGMLFIILVMVNIGIYFVFQYNLLQGEMDRTLDQARAVAAAVSTQPEENPASFIESYVSGDGMVRVLSPEGESLLTVTTQNTQLASIPTPEAAEAQERTESFLFEGLPHASAQVPVLWEAGEVMSLQVVDPLPTYQETLQTLQVVLIFASLIILLPSFLAARSLARFVLRPIQALVATMKQIQADGTFQKIDYDSKGKDELADMGRTFNHMIELLKQNYEKQQQFVSDASHELKTPLTVIDSYAQLLRRRGREKPEVFEEAVEAISSEAARMKEMTNQMLALATGESITVEKEVINTVPVFQGVAQQLATAYERKISVKGESTAYISGNELQLKQLAYLLIENAIKYSEQEVLIQIQKEEPQVNISIIDKGIGISSEDKAQIFDRFYRVDKARTRESGGTGLGLAIAENITAFHQGEIVVESEPGKGSIFTVKLPLVKEGGTEG